MQGIEKYKESNDRMHLYSVLNVCGNSHAWNDVHLNLGTLGDVYCNHVFGNGREIISISSMRLTTAERIMYPCYN